MKLKEGGYYRRRDGGIEGPIEQHGSHFGTDNDPHGWYDDGRRSVAVDSPRDLIAEVAVTPVLSFELRAGGKYTTQKLDGTAGPVVELRNSGIKEPALAYCFPFAAETFPRDLNRSWYITKLGQMVRYFADDGLRITGEYVEPKPPTPIERLEKWRDKMLAGKSWGADLDAIIFDLKAEASNAQS